MLGVLALLGLYVWHEAEEYRVLLPWYEATQHRLPARLQGLSLTPRSFLLIGGEQLALILGVWLLLPVQWWSATIFAYTFHLLVHCSQMLMTWRKKIFLPLWSAPMQLPMSATLYLAQPDPYSTQQLLANAVMTAVMVANLALMHYLSSRILQNQ